MASRAAPLSGIRVLEMGRLIAAPFCAQVLGDLGAEVIKVERVGAGDDIRTYGPPFLQDDDAPGGASSYFLAYNRNKRSIAVDFSRPEGAKLIRELAAKSDVFIENYKVGSLKRYGLDADSVRQLNPDIVYLSVSGFGQDGPYASRPATDVALQGMSGLMSMTGEADGAPQKVGVSIVDLVTGLYGAVAIISSLYSSAKARERGDWVGVSLLDCAMSLMGSAAIWSQLDGEPPLRSGNEGLGSYPSGLFPCVGGEILIQAGKDADFVRLCGVLGLQPLASDPRFDRRAMRVNNVEQLRPILVEAIGRWDRTALYTALVEAGIICGPVNDIAQAIADPQVVSNGLQQLAGHPDNPDLFLLGSPIRFGAGSMEIQRYPPRVGEHTAEILTDLLNVSPADIAELARLGVVSLGGEASS